MAGPVDPSTEERLPSIPGMVVLRRLGRGGMGDVLLARRHGALGFEKLVAVKAIRSDRADSDDLRSMFYDEAQLVARLDHPAIAQVHDFGEAAGILYLTMEYVAGLPLDDVMLRRGQPLPARVAVQIAMEVCRGLHVAHDLAGADGQPLGVVHRDINPYNLMLTFEGRIKILDFGIALMRDRVAPVTEAGFVKGKPSYMAPEQVRGEKLDRLADVFATGLVLYELATNVQPFKRESLVATLYAVETQAVPAPSTEVPGLPASFDAVVMRSLDKDPDGRFADARSMAVALEQLAAELPGPSLATFAETELAELRRLHSRQMRELLAIPGDPTPAPSASVPIPPSSARAATEASPAALPAAPMATAPDVAARAPGANGLEASTGVDVALGRRQKRTVLWAIGVIAVALLWATVAWVQLGTPETAPPVARSEPLPVAAPAPRAAPEPTAVPSEVRPPSKPPRRTPKRAARKKRRKSAPAPKVSPPPPPAEPPAPPPPPPRYGFLTVGAQPYAIVRLDGKQIGVTPIMRRKVLVGRHELELVHPDTHERRLLRTVEIDEGEHERVTATPR